ncbi:MAG TPA: Abi-alpha family protein [Solirubrobacterales bacterium]|nr:Abi-alpha family protein [Solirubrobacterales bacterium]
MTDERSSYEEPRDEREGVLDSVPGLARITASMWMRSARWYVGTSARVGTKLARAAVSPEASRELISEAADEVRSQARRFLGIVDSEGRVAGAVSGVMGERGRPDELPSLRDRGERLLRASADVHYEQGQHPAYERMLGELAPDEARILRMLAREGPQPAVDVRAGVAFVPGSRLVLQGFTMIGAEAGCRFLDQIPAYLSNLHRLGLIWFSRDPVRDRERYQVIEVQPPVLEALRSAGRFSHVVRRSIHLTPLGEDFCTRALPLDTAEFAALERHEIPDTA